MIVLGPKKHFFPCNTEGFVLRNGSKRKRRIMLNAEEISKEDDNAIFYGEDSEAVKANLELFLPIITGGFQREIMMTQGTKLLIAIDAAKEECPLESRRVTQGQRFTFGTYDEAVRYVMAYAASARYDLKQTIHLFPYSMGFFQYNREVKHVGGDLPEGIPQPPEGFVYVDRKKYNEARNKRNNINQTREILAVLNKKGEWVQVGPNQPTIGSAAQAGGLFKEEIEIKLTANCSRHPASMLETAAEKALIPKST